MYQICESLKWLNVWRNIISNHQLNINEWHSVSASMLSMAYGVYINAQYQLCGVAANVSLIMQAIIAQSEAMAIEA